MSASRYFPALALAVMACCATPVHAAGSDASALSDLPIVVLSAASAVVVVAGAQLTVLAVDASAAGTTWLLERGADGVRASVRFAGNVSVAVGTAVVVSAVASGHLLCVAGQAVAHVPNAASQALLYNERVTP